MTADVPTIVATSIGIDRGPRGDLDLHAGPIFDLAAELANAGPRPRMCWVGIAGGDDVATSTAVYGAFAGTRFDLSHLSLFPMPNLPDPRAHLLAQDIVWVGGGSVANLLAVWRVHELDEILRDCWEAGVVLGGVSAGSICWHVGGTTDSFGPDLRPVTDGLGFLPYSNGGHYDSEEARRPTYERLISIGSLPDGYATDYGVGLCYRESELAEVVADRPDAYAYDVSRRPDGGVREQRLTPPGSSVEDSHRTTESTLG